MDLGLTGRRAFIGGASRGLGYACAESLVREGARVLIAAREPVALEAARARLGGDTLALAVDLGRSEAGATAVTQAAQLLGGLDVLVVNAGGPPSGGFASQDDTAWRAAAELLLFSAVAQVRAALPSLRASDQARIVFIASTSIKQPIDDLILSNSVRAALAGLAKSLANELGPAGILVNVVCPGAIDTERIRRLDQARAERTGQALAKVAEARGASIPLGRIGRPAELGDTVAFLASARASYITGTILQVDGGATRSS